MCPIPSHPITVALKLADKTSVNHTFLAAMIASALWLYYVTVMVNARGNKTQYRFGRRWLLAPVTLLVVESIALFLVCGSTVAFLAVTFAISALLFGYYEYLSRVAKQQSPHPARDKPLGRRQAGMECQDKGRRGGRTRG